MSVGRLCTRFVVFATPKETVRDAAERMLERNVGAIVVVDPARIPVGIITDRDIVLRCVAAGVDPSTAEVEDVMTSPARTVSESTPIEEALRIMRNAGARRLVVTGEQNELVGILSVDDVLELLATEAEMIGNLLRTESPTV